MNKIKASLLALFFVGALNLGADGGSDAFSSAQWFFNARTNVNSAAIITGVAATWHALYYDVMPATKAGIDYAAGRVNQSSASKRVRKAARKFKTSIFLAGLAVAFEGVNKLYLRDQFYQRVVQ